MFIELKTHSSLSVPRQLMPKKRLGYDVSFPLEQDTGYGLGYAEKKREVGGQSETPSGNEATTKVRVLKSCILLAVCITPNQIAPLTCPQIEHCCMTRVLEKITLQELW